MLGVPGCDGECVHPPLIRRIPSGCHDRTAGSVTPGTCSSSRAPLLSLRLPGPRVQPGSVGPDLVAAGDCPFPRAPSPRRSAAPSASFPGPTSSLGSKAPSPDTRPRPRPAAAPARRHPPPPDKRPPHRPRQGPNGTSNGSAARDHRQACCPQATPPKRPPGRLHRQVRLSRNRSILDKSNPMFDRSGLPDDDIDLVALRRILWCGTTCGTGERGFRAPAAAPGLRAIPLPGM